jgi:hypothetical protein
MRKPKERIRVDRLVALAALLRELEAAYVKTVQDCDDSNIAEFEIEGWTTLVRGVQFIIDQSKKIVGPIPLRNIDPTTLLMPGQSYAPTRKPSKAVQEKLDDAHKQVAEAKKPYKKPPKDDPGKE